jgi:Matrixin
MWLLLLLLCGVAADSTILANGRTGMIFTHEMVASPAQFPLFAGPGPCATVISRGAAFRNNVRPVFHADTLPAGLDGDTFLAALNAAGNVWEAALSRPIFSDAEFSTGTTYSEGPNGVNEISFGAMPNANYIAYTIVWGNFGATSPSIDEADIVLNSVLPWGDSDLSPGVFDLTSILTHERGHSIGLGDFSASSCVDATMYAFASPHETKKRSLHTYDVDAARWLYSATVASDAPSLRPPLWARAAIRYLAI